MSFFEKLFLWVVMFIFGYVGVDYSIKAYRVFMAQDTPEGRLVTLCVIPFIGLCFYGIHILLKEFYGQYDDKLHIFNKLPHFGDMLNKRQVMKIIRKASFHKYYTRDGKLLDHVKISDDDKWVCILGGYMPVDLICGYNPEKNELYSIDGGVIRLPRRAKKESIQAELNSFFEARGICYTSMPKKANSRFNLFLNVPKSEIDKADFSRVRYQWEKATAAKVEKHSTEKYKPVSKKGRIRNDFFERVLSDKDVMATAKAVKQKKVELSHYLDFDAYKSEFSICNGVTLLEQLEYPANKEGIDFLFRCLGDVDEAYFGPAVDVLQDFPKSVLQEKLEEEAQRAYENVDVLGLAGLIYFAKQIGYEIKYIEELKSAQNAVKFDPTKAHVANTDVTKFDFDEIAAYGTSAAKGFSLGGMAYKEQA
ncbi:hypothetical protein [Butyrivibrio sp. AE3006]|uniref:hypothetical protein n=1 Tax=Butyrivibrio sp. AE3006 TaxID=1280673 RepID=UPI00040CB0F6|nr:hypothetical protein [Butyrivibrio sp. AE3006]